jgi:hypothetical protein
LHLRDLWSQFDESVLAEIYRHVLTR